MTASLRSLLFAGALTCAPAFAIVGPPPGTTPLPGLGASGSVFESPAGCGVVRSVALPTATDKQFRQQQDLAATPGLKIYVAQEGWYRVTRAAMVAAGFDPGADLKKLSLYMQGVEQPLAVNADSIEFYGQRLDTAAAGARTYWLRAGSANRLPVSHAKGGDPVAGDVVFTHERIERTTFMPQVTGNGDGGNWLGPLIWSEPTTQPLDLGNADAAFGGNATLEVTFRGGTDGAHPIRIDVNGHDAGTFTLADFEQKTFTLALPQAWLAAGANSVTFTALGGDWDFSVLASTRVTYEHLPRADNGAFEASFPGGRIATVGGFPSRNVRAVDVTDGPIELDTAVAADPAGGFSATFTPAAGGGRVVLVFDDSRVLAPAEMWPNRPSTWSDKKNAADLVIISNVAFAQAASALVPVRQRDGINAAVVDVEDLYDEFNFGMRGPEAIRAFLQSAAQWKTRPRWVLLVGDASVDPRNYSGLGAFDFVPTKLVDTVYLKTASDDWLADIDGDGFADYAIGRIPVRTADDATRVFDKIVARGTPSGAWANGVLSVFDRPEGYDFAASAAEASALVPSSLSVQKIDYAQSASPSSDTIRALNQGQLLVDYVGHGTVDLWGLDGVFTASDAGALVNGNHLPFVVAMNCLNGYFADIWSTSMAEALLEAPNGGAVGVWASSALTEPDGQQRMNTELFRQLFGGGNPTIGEAIGRAKRAVADPDVRKSWILFGDPSMKLK